MEDGHVLEPVPRPASLTDLAYQELRASVLSGALLRSGERLSVVVLAERLGMSRSPVRSAVERLVAEGLVTLQAAGVTLVRPTHAELLQLLEVRAVLEGLSARLAVPALNDAALDGLRELQQKFRHHVAGDDLNRARSVDLAFHQELMVLGGNPVLVEDLGRVQARVIVGTYTVAWSAQQHHAVDEHEQILRALTQRDALAAERASIHHMEQLMLRVRAASGESARG